MLRGIRDFFNKLQLNITLIIFIVLHFSALSVILIKHKYGKYVIICNIKGELYNEEG